MDQWNGVARIWFRGGAPISGELPPIFRLRPQITSVPSYVVLTTPGFLGDPGPPRSLPGYALGMYHWVLGVFSFFVRAGRQRPDTLENVQHLPVCFPYVRYFFYAFAQHCIHRGADGNGNICHDALRWKCLFQGGFDAARSVAIAGLWRSACDRMDKTSSFDLGRFEIKAHVAAHSERCRNIHRYR